MKHLTHIKSKVFASLGLGLLVTGVSLGSVMAQDVPAEQGDYIIPKTQANIGRLGQDLTRRK